MSQNGASNGRYGVLRLNHGSSVPRHHIFFDTETIEIVDDEEEAVKYLTWRLACAEYVRIENDGKIYSEKSDFDSHKELWDWIESKQAARDVLWIWAHNLGFDLTVSCFWDLLESKKYWIPAKRKVLDKNGKERTTGWNGYACLEGRPTVIVAAGRRGKVCIVDLANYIAEPLASIGESIGIGKLDMPVQNACEEDWIEYCRRDVDILRAAALSIMSTWKRNDCGRFRPTAGMLAMQSFRHLQETNDDGSIRYPIVSRRKEGADALERESYFGGLVECYYYGKVHQIDEIQGGRLHRLGYDEPHEITGPIYALDVQSHYPAIMAEECLPIERVSYNSLACESTARKQALSGRAIAHVLVDSTYRPYPIRIANILHYAVGKFWTTLCGPELQQAEEDGVILRFGEIAQYATAPAFRKWAMHWWNMKKDAGSREDVSTKLFCKVISVALSGKWAQCSRKWVQVDGVKRHKDWGTWTAKDTKKNCYEIYRAIGGNVQKLENGGYPTWAFPAISAFITSHGRKRMLDMIALCPKNSVLHCATDCLIVLQSGLDALIAAGMVQNGELGKLSIRGVYHTADFRGHNSYTVGDNTVDAGLWGRCREVIGERYFCDTFESLPMMIRNKPNDFVRVESVELKTRQGKLKGKKLLSGFTEPLRIQCKGDAFEPLLSYESRKELKLEDFTML